MDDIALATAAPVKSSHVEELAPLVAPATEEAIDAELLEIFLSEAVEVLDSVKQTIPDSRNAPHNQEFLTTLRRSFHTLKGSGRMVGLVTFGEAAWSVEQVLNLRLSETRGGDADLYALLENAVQVLDAWVGDLQLQGRSDRSGLALINAAERVKNDAGFHYDELEEARLVSSIEESRDCPWKAMSDAESITESSANFASEDAFAATEAEELELSDEELARSSINSMRLQMRL